MLDTFHNKSVFREKLLAKDFLVNVIETEKTAIKSNLLEDNSHEVSNGFVNKGRNLLQFGSKSCLPLLTRC